MDTIVIVGASAAGLTAGESLRRDGYDGRLVFVGAERHPPYDRPPLSKQVLKGTWDADRVRLRQQTGIDELGAEWLLGRPAVGLNPGDREVYLSDGSALGFEGLVIATGVEARRPAFAPRLRGVHTLRTVADALALRSDLARARSIVVIGAGFLGTEAAAVARELGHEVTVVDPLSAPMVRQLGVPIAERVRALHERRGVTLACGTGVRALEERNGAVAAVLTDAGDRLPADVVLVAVGSRPATDWLLASGLELDDGVRCDEFLRAAPGVVAAGDVASWPHPMYGRIRLEHRMNATEQGTAAARTLLGHGEPFAPIPYFWTDQYDVKIQVHGRSHADYDFRVLRPDTGDGRLAGVYVADGTVVGALTWNLPREARRLRALVGTDAATLAELVPSA